MLRKVLFTALLSYCLSAHLSAQVRFSYQDALKEFDERNLKQPAPNADGRVGTMNNKGGMAPGLDLASQAFVNESVGGKVIEIGGAYGLVMLKTLEQNPEVTYHLNDLDRRHLFIAAGKLRDAVLNGHIPLATAERVVFIEGNIIDSNIVDTERYDSLLIARVMHFFSPQELMVSAGNIAKLLHAGGVVYGVGVTPFVKRYRSFIPVYEKRVEDKMPFPGFIPSMEPYDALRVDRSKTSDPIGHYMFLDVGTLTDVFGGAGFEAIECCYVPLPHVSEEWQLDGRENVIYIGKKLHSKF